MMGTIAEPAESDAPDPRDDGSDDGEFARKLGDSIARKRLTLSAVHRILVGRGSPVSVATLSSWRTGRRHPEGAQSRAAIDELERILDLAPEALSSLIGAARRPGRVKSPGALFSDEMHESVTREMISALGADPTDWSREISSHTVVHVGADGGVREYAHRSVIQATTQMLRSLAFIVMVPPGSVGHPEFFSRGGGTVGAPHLHPSGTMIGTRFELDVPVQAPNTTAIEVGVRFPEGFPADRAAGKGVIRRAREVLVWVHFPPEARPDRVYEFEDVDGTETIEPRSVSGGSIHVARHGFGPGNVGIYWEYDA